MERFNCSIRDLNVTTSAFIFFILEGGPIMKKGLEPFLLQTVKKYREPFL